MGCRIPASPFSVFVVKTVGGALPIQEMLFLGAASRGQSTTTVWKLAESFLFYHIYNSPSISWFPAQFLLLSGNTSLERRECWGLTEITFSFMARRHTSSRTVSSCPSVTVSALTARDSSRSLIKTAVHVNHQ